MESVRWVSARRVLGFGHKRRDWQRGDWLAGECGKRHRFGRVPDDGSEDGDRDSRGLDPDECPGQHGRDSVRCGSTCYSYAF